MGLESLNKRELIARIYEEMEKNQQLRAQLAAIPANALILTINHEVEVKCERCKGQGVISERIMCEDTMSKCPACRGSGERKRRVTGWVKLIQVSKAVNGKSYYWTDNAEYHGTEENIVCKLAHAFATGELTREQAPGLRQEDA